MKCEICGRWAGDEHGHAADLLAAKKGWDDCVEANGWDSPMARVAEEEFQALWSRDYGSPELPDTCAECGVAFGDHLQSCSVMEEAWTEFRIENAEAYQAEDKEWGHE